MLPAMVVRLALCWLVWLSFSSAPALKSTAITAAPSDNKPAVKADPMPPAAPVTTAVRFSSITAPPCSSTPPGKIDPHNNRAYAAIDT